jgi:hypothetical protein
MVTQGIGPPGEAPDEYLRISTAPDEFACRVCNNINSKENNR